MRPIFSTHRFFSYKWFQTFLAFFSLCILLGSLYFQYLKHLEPCPLCLMQRFCVLCLCLVCLSSIFLKRTKLIKSAAILQIFFACAGLFFAGRQLWLQSLPEDQAVSCMPDLTIMLQYFPWSDIVNAFLWGSHNCSENTWQWLGVSIPAWVLGYFAFVFIASFRTFKGYR